jgi:hypothetical protein
VSKVFFSGVPTKPDVDKLLAKWPDINPGLVIEYSDIEKTIACNRKSHRYATVVTKWRKALYRDRNLVLEPLKGEAFEVLAPNGRIDYAHEQFKSGLRKTSKAAHIVSTTDQSQLDDSRKGVAEAVSRMHAMFALNAANPPKPVEMMFQK